MKDKTWTTKQMADYLQVDPRTFLKEVRKHGIVPIMVGRSVRFDFAEVIKALRKSTDKLSFPEPRQVSRSRTSEKPRRFTGILG